MNLAKHRAANLALIREALAHMTVHGTDQERAAFVGLMHANAATLRGHRLLLALMPVTALACAVNGYILRDNPIFIFLAVANAAMHIHWLYVQRRAQKQRLLEQGRAVLALMHLDVDLGDNAARVVFTPPASP